jgi:hypothetical protein
MGERIWRVSFEASADLEDGSLHDFIRREVNPLLDAGWSVRGVRIVGPGRRGGAGARLEVELSPGIWADAGLDSAP